jgi:hypothetical protein
LFAGVISSEPGQRGFPFLPERQTPLPWRSLDAFGIGAIARRAFSDALSAKLLADLAHFLHSLASIESQHSRLNNEFAIKT